MNHRISAGALVVHDNSILLVRHYQPERYDFWVAPGGGVIDSEDIYEAAKRETFEETGLHVEPIRLAYVEEFYNSQTRHCKFWLHCQYLGGNISIKSPEARSEYIVDAKFIAKEALRDKIVFPNILHDQFWQDRLDGLTELKYLGLREEFF